MKTHELVKGKVYQGRNGRMEYRGLDNCFGEITFKFRCLDGGGNSYFKDQAALDREFGEEQTSIDIKKPIAVIWVMPSKNIQTQNGPVEELGKNGLTITNSEDAMKWLKDWIDANT